MRTRTLSCLLAALAAAPPCPATGRIEPVLQTSSYAGANVDSVAVWAAPDPAGSLLFVTEKDLDRVEVWYAATGRRYAPKPFLGGERDSSAPGQFNRPNGVWVVDHVPFAGGFHDVLLVTDQRNDRVQAFRLPELEYAGVFGEGDLGKAYGFAAYQDGTAFYVYVTDSVASGKVKIYRLTGEGDRLGGVLVGVFGEESGPGSLHAVESILADPAHDRLHICGDEGGDFIRVFDLAGRYTGPTYGEPQFQYDQEGIALYDTGAGRGYIVVSDQYTNGQPNEFEIFDRVSLASLGHFESPAGAARVTKNTDGIFLCQRPLPGFPNGAFYAVNDDRNVHIYDWTDVAEAMDLEIAALDRPFAIEGEPGEGPAQRALWYADGSWWGIFTGPDGLGIRRLEDGTFARRSLLDPAPAARVAVAPGPADLLVLCAGGTARLHRLRYEPGRRRYVPIAGPVALDLARSADAALARDGEGRGWIAWAAGGDLRATWSAPGDLGAWDPGGIALGPARAACPEIVPFDGGIAVIGAGAGGARARIHRDGDPPATWSAVEPFGAGAVDALSAAGAGGEIIAALAGGGGGSVWLRTDAGIWTEVEALPAGASAPALTMDRATGAVYLFHDDAGADPIRIGGRKAPAPGAPSEPIDARIAWPAVTVGPPLAAREAPAGARDLVVAAAASDGLGRFARVRLPATIDRTPPITMQHDPAPGATHVGPRDAVTFRITDDRSGVDRDALRVFVAGASAGIQVRGVPGNLLVEATLPPDPGPAVAVRIEASDRADPPNVMAPFAYTFWTGAASVPFRRGDVNAGGSIDIADAIAILMYLFADGGVPPCLDAAETNGDGVLGIGDAIYLLAYIFASGPAPPAPGPEACGTAPGGGTLGCASYGACE